MVRINLTGRLVLAFLFLAFLIFAGTGALAYRHGTDSHEQDTKSALLSSSLEKEAAFLQWVQEKRTILIALATLPARIAAIETLTSSPPNSEQARSAHDETANDLQRWAGDERVFAELFVIDAQSGRTIVSTDEASEGVANDDQPYFVRGKLRDYVQPPYFDARLQAPAMIVATPIISGTAPPSAIIAGRLDLGQLYEIITRRSGLHASDDAFLVNAEGMVVTQPRLADEPAVMRLVLQTEAVKRCLTYQTGIIEADDYRGVPSIVSYRWMPEHSLCLIVKMSQAEALAPLKDLRMSLLWYSLVGLLATLLVALALARTITSPIRDLQTEVIGAGQGADIVSQVDHRNDELGVLARHFKAMVSTIAEQQLQLRRHAYELERLVDARTAALRVSEESYRRIFETAQEGIWIIDAQANTDFANQRMADMLGIKVEEMLGRSMFDFMDDAGKVAAAANIERRSRGIAEQHDFCFRRSDGSALWTILETAPIYDNDGKYIGAMAMIADITERKRAEDALASKAADLERSNSELEQFAYVASHDLQEPLRMVASYTQLLARRYRGRLDADADDFIGYAVDGATRMQSLINDLLEYSRVGTRGNPFQPTDVEDVLVQALANLKLTIQDSGATVTHDPLPTVHGDRPQLITLFQNLISNAVKFHGDAAPIVHISCVQKEKRWVFSVQDNGIGISPEYHEQIFVIFQRLHTRDLYPGTGIGLPICKKIVARHHGRIWVESQPGAGSTFYFTMPA